MQRFTAGLLALLVLATYACQAPAVDITTRASKGTALSHTELDTNFKIAAQAKTDSYIVIAGDNRDTIEVNATSATVTLTAASTLLSSVDTGDFEVTLKNTHASASVTVARSGSDTIDGATTYTLYAGEAATFKINQAGTGWNVVSNGQRAHTLGALSVAGAVDFDSTLNVDGAATFNGNMDLGNGASDIVRIPTTLPSLKFYENDQTTDGKVWSFYGQAGVFGLRLESDAYGAGEIAWNCTRSGVTQVGECTFDNGSVKIDEILTVDGSANFNAGVWRAGTSPDFFWDKTDATTNARLWRLFSGPGGAWTLSTRTDANGAGENGLVVSRAGTAIDTWLFDNGGVDIDETLNVDGVATFNDDVVLVGAGPDIWWNETDAGTDEKLWRQYVDGDSWLLTTRTDSNTLGEVGLIVDRTGVQFGTWKFDNGNVDVDEDLNVDGSLTHSKACATGYTRVAPGFCRADAVNMTVLTRDSCTSISLPAGATAALTRIMAVANNANSVGARLTAVNVYSNAGCSTSYDVSAGASAYEFSAIGSPGSITLSTNNTTVILGTGMRLLMSDDAGNSGSGLYGFLGYWDN